MYSKIKTAVLYGVSGRAVTVETDLSNGLPAFCVVGLPDTAVREAKERIRAALHNCGFTFPARRITVNLSPANLKKEGTHFDLPIAVGLLLAMGRQVRFDFANTAFLGELSLDGMVEHVSGIIPLLLCLQSCGITKAVIPASNLEEVKILKGMHFLPLERLEELLDFNKKREAVFLNYYSEVMNNNSENILDYSQVHGQEAAKRALQISAAGRHNILMIGPPGSGKTMLAERISTILPELSRKEKLEATAVHSAAGMLNKEHPVVLSSPVRTPHHSISSTALVGGGYRPKPGEISLAHKGVLFLDELPEFSKCVLELLRQPMESGKINISRAYESLEFPADFILVAAMNPCPCGYYGQTSTACTCSEQQVRKYRRRLSGPLMDRIDLQIGLDFVPFDDLRPFLATEKRKKMVHAEMDSRHMRAGVCAAVRRQKKRYKEEAFSFNGKIPSGLAEKYCTMEQGAKELLREAHEKMHLTARSCHKIIKVAQTICDLDQEGLIGAVHIAEAIQYRIPSLHNEEGWR